MCIIISHSSPVRTYDLDIISLRKEKQQHELNASSTHMFISLINILFLEFHRQKWDEDLLQWNTVEKLDQQTELFQFVRNSMAPHPTRDYCVLR